MFTHILDLFFFYKHTHNHLNLKFGAIDLESTYGHSSVTVYTPAEEAFYSMQPPRLSDVTDVAAGRQRFTTSSSSS